MSRKDLERRIADLHPDCFGWALNCCRGDRVRAEDTLQESYLKVLEGRARFSKRSTFRSWLFGVIRITALEMGRGDLIRAERRDRLRPDEFAPNPGPDPGVEIDRRRVARRLKRALGTLAMRQREVLHLVFYQEMTIEEASQVMGVTVGTARTHYQRGKRALRAVLTTGNERREGA